MRRLLGLVVQSLEVLLDLLELLLLQLLELLELIQELLVPCGVVRVWLHLRIVLNNQHGMCLPCSFKAF